SDPDGCDEWAAFIVSFGVCGGDGVCDAEYSLRGFSLDFIPHELEHYAINTCIFKPAFLKVLASAKLAECMAGDLVVDSVDTGLIVTRYRQQFLQFTRYRLVNHQDIFRVGWK